MEPGDPRPRHRKGAVPARELDGSVTLYGIENWTQLRDVPVLEILPSPTDLAPSMCSTITPSVRMSGRSRTTAPSSPGS
jgi:hypothetical protein